MVDNLRRGFENTLTIFSFLSISQLESELAGRTWLAYALKYAFGVRLRLLFRNFHHPPFEFVIEADGLEEKLP